MTRSAWLAVTLSLGLHSALVGWLVLGGWTPWGAPAGDVPVLEVRVVTEEAGKGTVRKARSRKVREGSKAGAGPSLSRAVPPEAREKPRMAREVASREFPTAGPLQEPPPAAPSETPLLRDPAANATGQLLSQGSRVSPPLRLPEDLLREIRARIERAKRYPLWARRRAIQGTATVAFRILEGGKVDGLRVVKSSGSALLDQAALEAVRRAVPFPRVPGEIQVSLVFRLRPLQAEAAMHGTRNP